MLTFLRYIYTDIKQEGNLKLSGPPHGAPTDMIFDISFLIICNLPNFTLLAKGEVQCLAITWIMRIKYGFITVAFLMFRFNQAGGKPNILPKIKTKTTKPKSIARKVKTDRSLFFITVIIPVKKGVFILSI